MNHSKHVQQSSLLDAHIDKSADGMIDLSSRILIPCKSTNNNIDALSLAMLEPYPILLYGPAGSGKSVLLRETSRLSCPESLPLLELHLDDQTDSRTLLGSYVCTDTPGEFSWQDGPLTRAITRGQWVLIEDLNCVPFEILAMLVPLFDNDPITIPGFKSALRPAAGFRLFGTVTTPSNSNTVPVLGGNANFGSNWTHVEIHPMEMDELLEISLKLYPSIPNRVTKRMYETFAAIQESGTTAYQHRSIGRIANIRDFFKLTRRVQRLVTFGDVEESAVEGSPICTELQALSIISEVFDVFAIYFSLPDRLESVVQNVAGCWNVRAETVMDMVTSKVPKILINEANLTIGRIPLERSGDLINGDRDSWEGNFTPTGQALRIMERLAACVMMSEPALLVGETGCGKTMMVQQLAHCLNKQLVVHNLSLQTDSADLLGGYKPLELWQIAKDLLSQLLDLFPTAFSVRQNAQYHGALLASFEKRQWVKFGKGIRKAVISAIQKLGDESRNTGNLNENTIKMWENLAQAVSRFERQRDGLDGGFAFTFIEGALVKALKEGHWVLLDEINLASAETLQRLSGLLEGSEGSLCLMERGDVDPIKRHPDFRIFASMNPPTDAAKKDLPPALRCRFTEIYVSELTNKTDLKAITVRYLTGGGGIEDLGEGGESRVGTCVDLYLYCRKIATEKLTDGGGQCPHYSLRSLCVALQAVRNLQSIVKIPPDRALIEGFGAAFETQLDGVSRLILHKSLVKAFRPKSSKKDSKQESLKVPKRPPGGPEKWQLVDSFWLETGPLERVDWADVDPSTGLRRFVLVPSVVETLRDLARAFAVSNAPILLQGPTSAGKTTLVQYMAAKLGYKCIRVNNHEHTDVQEYTGCYCTSESGQLQFVEGVLVEALRMGHWIILDELNLAPSEVLEALNRVLDSNRELLIPETQEVVKAHPSFRLFATQNPPGAYGGRKPLSRAFRNRFLELHIEDLPEGDWEVILNERCGMAPSHCKLLVGVLGALRRYRKRSALFVGKHGYISPRDLLRWASRGPSGVQEIAEEGYMLLAERLRSEDEKNELREILNRELNVTIDVRSLYDPPKNPEYSPRTTSLGNFDQLCLVQKLLDEGQGEEYGLQRIALTHSLRRLFRLVGRCLEHKEPVLLVGDTGCGKTTVCQLFSLLLNRKLHIVNCHASTEAGDMLGGLRPLRGRNALEDSIRTKARIFFASCKELNLAFEIPAIENNSTVDEVMLLVKKAWEAVEFIEEFPKRLRVDDFLDQQVSLDTKPYRIANSELRTEAVSLFNEICALEARSKGMFEWQDGPLVTSMQNGDMILLDELSLAEDAVLERLNSVLEPSRKLVLAEKGGGKGGIEEISAHDNFLILATMNPGGDFGKRELSPALRSRFTEIWVPAMSADEDIREVLIKVLGSTEDMSITSLPSIRGLGSLVGPILEFVRWYNKYSEDSILSGAMRSNLSLRDVLAWARFIVDTANLEGEPSEMSPWGAYMHGAAMVLLDGLGIGSVASIEQTNMLKLEASNRLIANVPKLYRKLAYESIEHIAPVSEEVPCIRQCEDNRRKFGINPFFILAGNSNVPKDIQFSLGAPTTYRNIKRVLRAMQLRKAILLEGSPGVGKTSLISALAAASGHTLVRINLSEQTDLSDLMGSDLPTVNPVTDYSEDSGCGGAGFSGTPRFEWCDGIFLRALRAGHWVLLDELNLASQTVLEGLNACLDHREEVYIPELGRSFHCPSTFRVFAAQNPLSQGGGRKGMPKSFLNRFTKVFVDALTSNDLIYICSIKFPLLINENSHEAEKINLGNPISLLDRMVNFNSLISHDTSIALTYGRQGSPWEFNLRDIFRWGSLMMHEQPSTQSWHPEHFIDTIYLLRFRTSEDRRLVLNRFFEIFPECMDSSSIRADSVGYRPYIRFTPHAVQIGQVIVPRGCWRTGYKALSLEPLNSVRDQCNRLDLPPMGLRRALQSMGQCVGQSWPCLVVGARSTGKTWSVRWLAKAAGADLCTIALTPATDVSELLGYFEQVDSRRDMRWLFEEAGDLSLALCAYFSKQGSNHIESFAQAENILHAWQSLSSLVDAEKNSPNSKSTTLELYSFSEKFLSTLSASLKLISDCELHHCIESQVENLKLQLNALSLYETTKKKESRFQWTDGILVRALESGQWLLLENANFCPSSVLDRLNPLLEPDGELLLTECGTVSGRPRIIKPHPNFRLFLTCDPSVGEVSRAMRNRCIEICLLETFSNESSFTNMDVAQRLTREASVMNSVVLTKIIECHKFLVADAVLRGSRLPSIMDLIRWGQFSNQIVLQDAKRSLFEALVCTLPFGYAFMNSSNFQHKDKLNSMLHESVNFNSPLFAPTLIEDEIVSAVRNRSMLCAYVSDALKFLERETTDNLLGDSCKTNALTALALLLPSNEILDDNQSIVLYPQVLLEKPHKEIISTLRSLVPYILAMYTRQMSYTDLTICSKILPEEYQTVTDIMISILFDLEEMKILKNLQNNLKSVKDLFSACGVMALSSYAPILSNVDEDLWSSLENLKETSDLSHYLVIIDIVYSSRLVMLWKELQCNRTVTSIISNSRPSEKGLNWLERAIFSHRLSKHEKSIDSGSSKFDTRVARTRIIPFILPLIHAIDALVKDIFASACKDFEFLSQLLRCRDDISLLLSSSKFNFNFFPWDLFLTAWRWFRKSLQPFLSNIEYTKSTNMILSICVHIDVGICEYSGTENIAADDDVLWKMGGHPSLASDASHTLALNQLRSLSQTLKIRPHNGDKLNFESYLKAHHPISFASNQLRLDILQGLSTLHLAVTDEWSNADFDENLEPLLLLPKKLNDEICEARNCFLKVNEGTRLVGENFDDSKLGHLGGAMLAFDADDQATLVAITNASIVVVDDNEENRGVLVAWSEVQLAPLFQHWGAIEELSLLSALSHLSSIASNSNLCSSTVCQDVVAISTRVKFFVDVMLEKGLTPPDELRPYQSFLWAIDTANKNVEAELFEALNKILMHLLPKTLPLHLQAWGTRMFNALFNFDNAVSMDLSPPPILPTQVKSEELIDFIEHLDGLQGPPRLFHCVRSSHLLKLQKRRATILNASAQAKQFKSAALLVLKYSYKETPKSVLTLMLDLAISKFIHIIVAFKKLYASNETYTCMMNKLVKSSFDVEDDENFISDIRNILFDCSSERLRSVIDSALIPAVRSMMHAKKSKEFQQSIVYVGLAFSFLGSAQLFLLLPSLPIDPGQAPAAKKSLLSSRLDEVSLDITARTWSRKLERGGGADRVIAKNISYALELQKQCTAYGKQAVARCSSSDVFRELFNELYGFTRGLGSMSRIKSLADSLRDGNEEGSKRLEEKIWQESCGAFMARLESRFGGYEDVTAPVSDAISSIRMGLRLLAYKQIHSTESKNFVMKRVVASLLRFPFEVADGDTFVRLISDVVELNIDGHQKTAILQAFLSRLELLFMAGTVEPKCITVATSRIMSYMVELWLINAEKEEEKRQKEAEMVQYKAKTHDVMDDAAVEEKRMRSLFPDFHTNFKDIVQVGSETVDQELELDSNPSDNTANFKCSDDIISSFASFHWRLGQLHLRKRLCNESSRSFFSDSEKKQSNEACIASDKYRLAAFESAHNSVSLVQSYIDTMEADESLGVGENHFAGSHFLRLCDLSRKCSKGVTLFEASSDTEHLEFSSCLANAPSTVAQALQLQFKLSDFYHSPNPSESRLVDNPVVKLLHRCTVLLQEFPGNAVLIQISRISDRLRRTFLDSSLAAVLIGVEITLTQAHKWEQNAHRLISLAPELKPLSALVVRWRRMELDSWPGMIKGRELAAIKRAMCWWNRLYSLIISRERIDDIDCSNDWMKASADTSHYFDVNWASSMHPGWLWRGLSDAKIKSDKIEGMEKCMSTSFFDAMDQFLRTSTVGEFHMRLELVRAFVMQLRTIGSVLIGDDADVLFQHRANVLYGLWQYYNQFSNEIITVRDISRISVEKRLKSEVKLGKWDEQTYYSLAESAEKSHRKLSKLLHEYDDTLQVSAATIIHQCLVRGIGERSGGEVKPTTEVPSLEHTFTAVAYLDHISDLVSPNEVQVEDQMECEKREEKKSSKKKQKKFSKTVTLDSASKLMEEWTSQQCIHITTSHVFQNPSSILTFDKCFSNNCRNEIQLLNRLEKLSRRMRSIVQGTLYESLPVGVRGGILGEQCCQAIFSRIHSLRGDKVAKQVKKRAIIDLFKGLRELGLTSSRSATPPESRNALHVLSLQSPFEIQSLSGNIITETWTRADGYYYRTTAELTRLRLEASAPMSKDINLREAALMTGFSDHMQSIVLQQRGIISVVEKEIVEFREALKVITTGVYNSSDNHILEIQKRGMRRILESIEQVHLLLKAASNVIGENDISGFERSKNETQKCVDYVRDTLKTALFDAESAVNLNSTNDSNVYIDQFLSIMRNVHQSIQQAVPKCQSCIPVYVLSSIINNIDAHIDNINSMILADKSDLSLSPREDNTDLEELAHAVHIKLEYAVKSLLLAMQSMTKSQTEDKNDISNACDSNDDEQQLECIMDLHIAAFKQARGLKLSHCKSSIRDVQTSLVQFSQAIHNPNSPETQTLLLSLNNIIFDVTHLANQVVQASESVLRGLIIFNKGSAKLSYVLSRVFRTLLSKGICSDETKEVENDGKNEDFNFDETEGTGMGEGEGKKDVTDQIEDEEQLLGLKNDLKDPNKKNEKNELNEENKDEGMEMANDFEGEMYDVPKEEQDRKDNESEEGSNEEEEELDREMGEAGDDADVVDEKLWESDADEDDDDKGEPQQEKFEKDSRMDGEQLEDEIRTKEDEGSSKKKDDKETGQDESESGKKPESKPTADEEIESEDGPPPINDDLEDNYEDKPQGVDVRGEEEAHEGQNSGDDFELPEDMNLDGASDDDMDTDENDDVGDNQDDAEGDSEGRGSPIEEANVEDENDVPNEEGTARQNVGGQDNMNIDEDNLEPEDNDESLENLESSAEKRSEPAHGVRSKKGDSSILSGPTETDEKNDDGGDEGDGDVDENPLDEDTKPTEGGAQGGTSGVGQLGEWRPEVGTSTQHPSKSLENKRKKEAPNPLRTPGSSMEHWHRRLDMLIQEEENDENPDTSMDIDEIFNPPQLENQDSGGKFEYSEENKLSTTQVLGGVSDEQTFQKDLAQNNDFNSNNPDDQDIDVDAETAMQDENCARPEDDSNCIADTKSSDETQNKNNNKTVKPISEVHDKSNDEVPKDIGGSSGEGLQEEGVLNLEDEICSPTAAETEIVTNLKLKNTGNDRKDDYNDDEMDIEENWKEGKQYGALLTLPEAQERWGKLRAYTGPASQRLCEQLRLVLTPQVATKLQGDYRTGKRINMRRVISYIASGFRRDKIWLRRTKPAKRAYQILLAIDDSESMADCGAANFAMEALALVASGLSQLEVGQIAVAKFGEKMEVVHGFDDPFTDESGSKILSSFGFNQGLTRTGVLLETAEQFMESSASEISRAHIHDNGIPRQLMLVISDGHCERESRPEIQKRVRDMGEKGQLVALVIIDRGGSDSIVNMESVCFSSKGVETKRYLDGYPFPYYIVLRNVQALPEILADALRQWFELVQNQMDI